MALLARPRVLESLFDASSGATLVTAGAGFGKSVAVRQFLAATTRSALHYEVPDSAKTLVPFVRGFVDAAADVVPNLQTSFPSAIEYAMQSPKPHEEIAVWMLDHLDNGAPNIIAIEDVHHAGQDEEVRRLLSRLIRASAPRLRWIFTSRDVTSVPLQEVAADGVRTATIDSSQLRLTQNEADIIARDVGLNRELTDELYRITDGWPAAFHLGAHVFDGGRIPAQRTYDFFAQAYLVKCSNDVQAMLMGASVLGEVDEELLARSPWSFLLDDMRQLSKNGLIFSARSGGRYSFHELFRNFLLERIGPPGSGGRRSAMIYGATLLEHCGRIPDALELLEQAQDTTNVVRICVEHGFELVDQGRLDLIRRAISMAGDARLHENAPLMALRGIDESQQGRYDTAESWFLHALKVAETSESRAKIAYRYALDLIRQRRAESVGVLEPYIGEHGFSIDLYASILSVLATGYVLAERFDDAARTIAEALRLIDVTNSRALHAKIYQHAAWIAIFTGDVAGARKFSKPAVELALACGLYDVAGRAYSVLYNAAYDVEDDARSALHFLNKIWACGLKCGELKLRLYAALGIFDIAAEIGDVETLRKMERTLEAHELNYPDHLIDEMLLSGQALRLAASADFVEAYRLLSPTGARQSLNDHGALRFAETAMYAAAAGLYPEATKAAAEAESYLGSCDERAHRSMRARSVLACALYLLGRRGEAKIALNGVLALHQDASVRTRALAEALEALFARWEGINDHASLLEALDALRVAGYGGIAAVLAALPSDPALSIA